MSRQFHSKRKGTRKSDYSWKEFGVIVHVGEVWKDLNFGCPVCPLLPLEPTGLFTYKYLLSSKIFFCKTSKSLKML